MSDAIGERFKNELRDLVVALVDDELERLENRGELGRCRKEDLRRVIPEYPARLAHPPGDFVSHVRSYELSDGTGWSVDVDLWDHGGRSDLTLQLDIKRHEHGYRFVITDLHVL